MPLTAIDPLWINASAGAPSYDAEELRRDLGYLLTGGADPGVSKSGVLDPRGLLPYLSGNDVWLPVGGAALGTLKGVYITGNKAGAKVDTLAAADATNPRRDRIVLVVLDPDNGSTSSTSRTAEFRVITGTPSATAPAGGGYPAEPSAPNVAACLTLGWVDVPKSGGGSPAITDQRSFTAAAGAPAPVLSVADRDGLPKWAGRTVSRLDRAGVIERWNNTAWSGVGVGAHMEIGRTGAAITGGSLWGPGSAAEMQAGIAPGPTFNQTIFGFPGFANQLNVTEPGLYSISWAITRFSRVSDDQTTGASGYILIRNTLSGTGAAVHAAKQFSGTLDISVELPNIFLAAGEALSFNFQIAETGLKANHRLRLTKIG